MEAPSVFVPQRQGCKYVFLVCTENFEIQVLHHLVHRAARLCESLLADVRVSLNDVINMEKKKIQTTKVKIACSFLTGNSTLCGV